MGKSQVAAHLARKANMDRWHLIAWISGDDEDRIISDFAELATKLRVASPEEDAQSMALQAREYLNQSSEKSLLVIDNAVEPSAVSRWLPTLGNAIVIITTTNRALSGLGTLVAISVFDDDQSQRYLMSRTRLDFDQGVLEIAGKLGNLPLALAQAASVIKFYGIT